MIEAVIIFVAFLPVSIAFAVIGRLLAPVLALFCDEQGWLPEWLSWFQTPDTSCDGDAGHHERWPKEGAFWTYARRVAWLLRNVSYGFDIQVLGADIFPGDTIKVSGNPDIGESSGISGLCIRELVRDGKTKAFQFFFVRHYQLFGVDKCVRIGAGWKLWNGVKEVGYKAQYWAFFNPIK
ncbi:MAG TPA: hypothetical protein IAC66_07640 [Candidatus Aphodousia gallistercoris]|nr:hypothetical protein [Candidatus Aphodousia gallistercoris]